MAKTRKAERKPKRKTIKRLPKSTNGAHRKTTGFGSYAYQKETLRQRARRAGVSMSYYLNMLLWKDWL